MLSIAPKFRALLLDHIETAQPDELSNIVERLLGDVEPPIRNSVIAGLPATSLARLPFAERVIKLGADGRPLERQSDPHTAVYDPLLDLTHARGDLLADEVKMGRADDLAAGCRLFGLQDWRLPTVFEQISAVDRKRYNPAVDTSVLDVKPAWYWTSEAYAPDPAGRWCVLLYDGSSNGLSDHSSAFARAVRAGQCFGFRP